MLQQWATPGRGRGIYTTLLSYRNRNKTLTLQRSYRRHVTREDKESRITIIIHLSGLLISELTFASLHFEGAAISAVVSHELQ